MTSEPLAVASAAQDDVIRRRNDRVMENQGLVHKVARGFQGRGVAFEDLIQFGNIGLIRAAEKFEPERGLRFSTYAVHWIRQAIFKGIADTSRPIYVPLHAQKDAKKVLAASLAIEAEAGVPPMLSEVVAAMEGDPRRRGRKIDAAAATRAKFKVVDAEMVTVHDSPSEDAEIDAEHRERLARALPLLPDSHRRLLAARYGLEGGPPLGLQDAAARAGLFWQQFGRAEKVAIECLAELVGETTHLSQSASARS